MGGKFEGRGTASWQRELARLRAILRDFPLTEEVKWGKPCFTFETNNVAILYRLKDSCALGFLKGALLKDAKGLLGKPGENSQAMRWFKFTDVREIDAMEATVKAYIREAIAVEQAGLEIDFKQKRELVFPAELRQAFADDPAFKRAFEALTPGRQRGYNLYFTAAKQSATRVSRIEASRQGILAGKGRNDR